MKLFEQRNRYREACQEASKELRNCLGFLSRKCSRSYPDGHCDNLVNYETDVAPFIRSALEILEGKDHEER